MSSPPIAVPFIAEPSVLIVRSHDVQSLASHCNVHILSFSDSPDIAQGNVFPSL